MFLSSRLIILVSLSTSLFSMGQNSKAILDAQNFQAHLNSEFKNPDTSPLPMVEIDAFKQLDFFSISEKFMVEASFKRIKKNRSLRFKTTTDRRPKYQKYGTLTFQVDGRDLTLTVYQSHQLREKEEYKNHLFVPFTDLSNGETSYGGGRFLDLELPLKSKIILDFNKTYNPYCAYNHIYSCPIPPRENHLKVFILAGVKAPKNH
ncbi:MAG: hypothetical protein ACJAY8_001274 [Sphingobacteriales bacterium]|jgi:uncharacterized protein (DUF1684 family)